MPLYAPALFVTMANGMLIPVLPLYLRDAGLSYSSVSTVLAAVGAGALVAQLPLGAVLPRFSERGVMLVAHVVVAAATAALGVATMTIALVSLRAVAGIGSTAWLLSRHSYLTRAVHVDVRGRASSAFGGVIRIGTLVGPLTGGWVAAQHGFTTAFVVIGVTTMVGALPHLMSADSLPGTTVARSSLAEVVRQRWSALARAGTIQLGFIMVRIGRFTLLPFLGAAIGMDVAAVGVLIAIGSAAELPMVPVAGWLMDRFGRAAAIGPSLIMLGGGLVLAGVAQTATQLTAAAVVIGVGNGIGAGSMLTLGSDLAPQDEPTGFLSILGLMREVGRILGPLAVGWSADALGLTWSAVVLAAIAIPTAVFMMAIVGDTRRPEA